MIARPTWGAQAEQPLPREAPGEEVEGHLWFRRLRYVALTAWLKAFAVRATRLPEGRIRGLSCPSCWSVHTQPFTHAGCPKLRPLWMR